MLQGEYMLDFAHVFARALNNIAHVGARARNNAAHESARTRNSRTFYVANVPAYGIAVCLFVCLSVCQYVRRLSVAVRRLSVARGVSVNFEYMLQGEYILKGLNNKKYMLEGVYCTSKLCMKSAEHVPRGLDACSTYFYLCSANGQTLGLRWIHDRGRSPNSKYNFYDSLNRLPCSMYSKVVFLP
eukprot:scaffold133245_cov50-Attheya_sp.AAC.7